jgi:hypothetical protein
MFEFEDDNSKDTSREDMLKFELIGALRKKIG